MQKNKRMLTRYLGLMLLLFSVSISSFAQQNIRGKVFDPDGEPLLGATVVVVGSTTGTITDVNGDYSVNAPSSAELKFSYVGMANLIEKVNGRTTINVTLKSDAISLNEVVAVGYGTMKKTDITGAVSNLSGEKLASLGSFSAAQALQGKLAGVTVLNNGDAGSDAKIRIRGITTVGSNEPLIVIDGITNGGSIKDIHPSDIASIDVLKDASALAIYGSRASSGVVLITTKKGKYGTQKINVTLDASYGVANVNKRLDLTNATEKVAMIDEARANENKMRNNTAYKLYDELWPNDSWGRTDLTDWQDELFSTGNVQDYALNVSGGSEKAVYSFSASVRDESGVMPGNFAKRMSLRGNIETKTWNDRLKIGSNLSFTTKESQGSSQGDIWSADLFGAAMTPTNIAAYKDNGLANQITDGAKIAYFTPGGLYQNNSVIWNEYSNPNFTFVNQLYADLQIMKGLNYRFTIGQNVGTNYSRNYKIASENPEGGQSSLEVSSNLNRSTSIDNVLTYDTKINDLSINATLGMNTLQGTNVGINAGRVQFPVGDIQALRYMNFGLATSQTNSEGASQYRLLSHFGRANLNYQDKYLLTATVRRDASTRFYDNVQVGYFPSASLGWRISEEDFLKSLGWVDQLKVRGSWGQVGNQNVGENYAYVSSVRTGYVKTWGDGDTDYALGTGSTRNTGRVVWNRGNLETTWETTNMTNIGLDYSLFGFSGSFELFDNKTSNILLPAQVTDIAGYYPGTTPKVNSGEVETKGFDLSINYSKRIGELGFSVGTNLSYSENEILSLDKNLFVASGYGQNYKSIMGKISRSYVGDPIGSFYGYNAIGIFQTQAEVDAANKKARDYAKSQNPALTDPQLAGIYYSNALTAPGDRIFEDVDGDGKLTSKDEVNLGCGNPKFQFGLNLSADYKGFDLTANFSGAAGVQVYSMFEPALSLPGRFNSLTSISDHWTPTNPSTNFPRYTMSDPNGNGRASNIWIHDASYVRLQNLVVGYTLPTKLVKKANLSSVRFYASVQNVFTLTKYPFLEPEVISNEAGLGNGSVDLTAGVDVGSAPLPQTIMLGVNLKF